MKLYWSPNSPYARKVVVATKEMQIDHCVEIIETSAIPTKANEVLSALNPLTRIPTLQLKTGEILFDSSAICDYLNEFSDGGLLPEPGPRPQHLPHRVPRHLQVAGDLLDRLALDEVLAPDPGNRLHDQHPQPPASLQSRQRNRPTCRGSILDADPPA